MTKVYFARAMDGIEPDEIIGTARKVSDILTPLGLLVVDPFQLPESRFHDLTFEQQANHIVDQDLGLLKTADAVLMDCSIPNRSYVGCICELVYAYQWNIPSFVYVGESGNEKRYWLHYHAKAIRKTLAEAVDTLIAWNREMNP